MKKPLLPTGWEMKAMPQVVKWTSGGTPKSSTKEYYDGNIPWLVIGDLNDGIVYKSEKKITQLGLDKCNAKLLPQGTLLLAMYGSIGKLGIAGIECCTNQAIASAKELFSVTTLYMFYYLMFIKLDLHAEGKGGTQKNISLTVINSIEIPLPTLAEQEGIVQKIEELFSELNKGIEELTQAKARLKVYRQAVLKDAFEGKLIFANRLPIATFSFLPEKTILELPTIPNEWKYVLLCELGELARGKSKHRPRNDKKLFEEGKYPFIQTGDVKNAKNYITSFSTMYGEFGLSQSKLWNKGTLCITIAANIAETAFLAIDACFPDSVVGFTPNENLVLAKYIRYFIDASKIRLWAFAPATAQKNINLTTLENLIIPYCSIDEQQYIVTEIESRLSICDNIEQIINDSLKKAENLRQSILKKAFAGELV